MNYKYCKLLQRNDGYSYCSEVQQILQKSALNHTPNAQTAQSTSSSPNPTISKAYLWYHKSGVQKLISIVNKDHQDFSTLADALWLSNMKNKNYFKARLRHIVEPLPGVHSVYGWRLVRQW